MPGIYNTTANTSEDNYFQFCYNYWGAVLTWFTCSIVTAVFGFPASMAVLWELFQKYRRGTHITSNDVFMLNLTIMDAVFLFFLPIGVINYVIWHKWAIEFVFNVLYTFSMSGRPIFMTFICLDCYLAVVHPIMYRTGNRLTSRVVISVCVWVFTVVVGVLYSTFHRDLLCNSIVGVLPAMLAIFTIGICDFLILRTLKSSDPAGRDLHPQKKKARQIIINSLVMTAIAYFPQLLLVILGSGLPGMSSEFYHCVVNVPFVILISTSCGVMPVLYVSNLGKLDLFWLWCRITT